MRTRWAAVLLATGLLVAGCGSSDSGGGAGTPTPAPSPATSAPSTPAASSTASAELCADAADLQASLNRLVTITVGPNAVTELRNDLAGVQSCSPPWWTTPAPSGRTRSPRCGRR